jgi:hypothetical protein
VISALNRDHILADAEFGQLALGLDLGLAEIAAVGLVHIVGAARTGAELERDIAVLVLGAMGHDLALHKLQHRHRHMLTGIGEHPGHSDLLRNYSGTHRFPHLGLTA